MNRREFLQSLLAFGVAVALPLELATASGASTFGIDTASDAEVDAILDSGAYDFVVSEWGSISFVDFAEPASREKIASCNTQLHNRKRIVDNNALAYVIRDGFPVTQYHSLFIPKRHVADYFGLTQAEINAINQLIKKHKKLLDETDSTIDGYNIGMNCGESAGQTVFHYHLHLIPRRKGDVENPRGGIRHLMPGKDYYPI